MIRLPILITLILAAQVAAQAPSHPQSPAVPSPAQDIDTYDKAGPYEKTRELSGDVPKEQVARIQRSREWLWEHWTRRRQALLIETSYSIEGDRATFYYFVEPDKHGKWRIGIKIERLVYDRRIGGAGCQRFVTETYSSYAVTRIDAKTSGSSQEREIQFDEIVSSQDYQIRMKLQEERNFIYY